MATIISPQVATSRINFRMILLPWEMLIGRSDPNPGR